MRKSNSVAIDKGHHNLTAIGYAVAKLEV